MVEIRNRCLLSLVLAYILSYHLQTMLVMPVTTGNQTCMKVSPCWIQIQVGCAYTVMYNKKCEKVKEGGRGWLKLVQVTLKRRNIKN